MEGLLALDSCAARRYCCELADPIRAQTSVRLVDRSSRDTIFVHKSVLRPIGKSAARRTRHTIEEYGTSTRRASERKQRKDSSSSPPPFFLFFGKE